MKKYRYLLLLLLLIIPMKINALVERSEDIYVTDEGKMLKDETKDYIMTYSNFLDIEKDVQYYVVTVKNLDENKIEDYSKEVFQSFDLDDRGILLLISKEDREFRIEVGDEISSIVSTEQVDGYINDYFMPYFKNGEWDKGILNGYLAIYKDLANYYKIDTSGIVLENGNQLLVKYKVPIICIVIFLNTIITQALCLSIKKINNKYDRIDTLDKWIMPLLLIINVLLLAISYMVMPLSLLLVIGIEGYAMFVNFTNNDKKTESLKAKKEFQQEMKRREEEEQKKKEEKKKVKMAKQKHK